MRLYRVGDAVRYDSNGDKVPIGKGLFATQDIAKHTMVIRMNPAKVKFMAEKKWLKYCVRHNIPHDGAVFIRGKGRITDWETRMPLWYRLNHPGGEPTVKMRFNKKERTIEWVAREDIKKGRELVFRYGENTKEFDQLSERPKRKR